MAKTLAFLHNIWYYSARFIVPLRDVQKETEDASLTRSARGGDLRLRSQCCRSRTDRLGCVATAGLGAVLHRLPARLRSLREPRARCRADADVVAKHGQSERVGQPLDQAKDRPRALGGRRQVVVSG